MLSLLILISLSTSQSTKPKSLLFPVSKDSSTLQYLTHFGLGTPLVSRTFVLDLGGRHLWMACENGYTSSTYKPGRCGSAPCSLAKAFNNICSQCTGPPRPGCTNNTCSLIPENSIKKFGEFDELAMDIISLQSIVGSEGGPFTKIPNFIFACSNNWLLDGLASGAKGMAGFGRNPVGMSTQLSSIFGGSLHRKFALCLPSAPKTNGVLFVGDAPYVFHPSDNTSILMNVKERLHYTRLYINPVSTGRAAFIESEPSNDYFIGVKSIMIDMKPVPVNTKLLSFNRTGFGGTSISTIDPYMVLESSIYKAVTKRFAQELKAVNVSKVAPVAPFTECFSTENLAYTQLGPAVPDIQFVFENRSTYWQFSAANLMVEISRDVVCLAFVDGGVSPRTSIIIGAHQLEDNLVEFDLASSRLGFTSTLIMAAIECANFNF